MTYSRTNPSPRYVELIGQYRRLHEEGEPNYNLPPERTFRGLTAVRHGPWIKRLIEQTGCKTILDYGSGKGAQYLPDAVEAGSKWPTLAAYWGVDVTCYDPAYQPFSRLPEGQFDGVICTDVLEHCPEQDIPWILDEMFGFARKLFFANVACYPARKHLPNGENAHCTIKDRDWWVGVLKEASRQHPGVRWEVHVHWWKDPGPPPVAEGCILASA